MLLLQGMVLPSVAAAADVEPARVMQHGAPCYALLACCGLQDICTKDPELQSPQPVCQQAHVQQLVLCSRHLRRARNFVASTCACADAGLGRTLSKYKKREKLFEQGGPADAVFFVLTGKVKLTVLSGL